MEKFQRNNQIYVLPISALIFQSSCRSFAYPTFKTRLPDILQGIINDLKNKEEIESKYGEVSIISRLKRILCITINYVHIAYLLNVRFINVHINFHPRTLLKKLIQL